MMGGGGTMGKPICSICFEDLKLIAEDLQTISSCGHVFHELCLQQWFVYCSDGKKKKSCPVCKQTCTNNNILRLYFQSITDSSQVPRNDENVEDLVNEKKKLEAKLSGMTSSVEEYQKELKALREEVRRSLEEARAGEETKEEALKQKSVLQSALLSKSEELRRRVAESSKLQERNLSLARELAALKLATDVTLDEDEVSRLSCFGGGAEALGVLTKSLVSRNHSYKELMAKCNAFARGEARSLRKLEKTKAQLRRVKERLRELEMSAESTENDALRAATIVVGTPRDEGCPTTVVDGGLLPVEGSDRGTPRDEGCPSPAAIDASSHRYSGHLPCIRKDSPLVSSVSPPDICFMGGLTGPDGSTRYLGKWCKRRPENGGLPAHPSPPPDELITVGADGRGGKVKALRPFSCSMEEHKNASPSLKRSRSGFRTSAIQPKACSSVQLENFFQKIN